MVGLGFLFSRSFFLWGGFGFIWVSYSDGYFLCYFLWGFYEIRFDWFIVGF